MRTVPVPTRTLRLEPGDSLVFVSDGFAERFDANGTEWGYDTVEYELERICGVETTAERIAASLVAACNAFAGGRDPDDDTTVVVVTAKPG
jgi:serine phosphatase RsbU (regulator of sigma subunit)